MGGGRQDGEHRLISRASSHFSKMEQENPKSKYGLNSINNLPNWGVTKNRQNNAGGKILQEQNGGNHSKQIKRAADRSSVAANRDGAGIMKIPKTIAFSHI